jgi:sulfate/thiosulfate-binding protein
LNRVQAIGIAAGLLLVSAAAAACGGSSSANGAATTKINLVAYSTPEASYKELIPAFAKTSAGDGSQFTQSYGASGDQSKAVEAGQAADVVHFALEPDIKRLVDAGKVAASWDQGAQHGIVADTEVVFAVRKGNPKNIHTWDDLLKPGIGIVQPNPVSSGGARWDVMAAYGQALAQKKSPAQALSYLKRYYSNIVSQDKSGRDALNTFLSGKGDVLIGYESEALPAIAAGNPVELIRPSYTLEIQNPIAVSGASSNTTQAKAFVQYLLTPAAQTIWAQDGYRPVDSTVFAKFKKSFPTPHGVFKITDFGLGGWSAVTPKFFDPTNGIVTKIASGV